MTQKALEARINDLITADLAAMGYDLVRVQATSGGRYTTLQVMAERADEKPMTVNDCAEISRAITAKLEVDPALADMTLEISSPGIDRPLVRLKDFERYTGHVARVELEAPLSNAKGSPKRFQGSITRITGAEPLAEIEFHTETGNLRVPMKTISSARLVLTDALMNIKGGTKH